MREKVCKIEGKMKANSSSMACIMDVIVSLTGCSGRDR